VTESDDMEGVHTHVESETRDVSDVYLRSKRRTGYTGLFHTCMLREFYHRYVKRQVFTRIVVMLKDGQVREGPWTPAGDAFEVDLGFSNGIAS
jgi:hypothetical protein